MKRLFIVLICIMILPNICFAEKIYFDGLELNLLSDVYEVSREYVPSEKYAKSNWNYEAINSENAYKLISEPKDVIIAVVDSGLYYSHIDLNPNNIYEGVNYLTESGVPIKDTFDSMGHGTKNIGIIQRVNPIAKILPIHVVGENGKTDVSRTIKAINEIIEFNDNQNNKIKIKVINLSLASLTYIELYDNAIQDAINNGIIVIASVGNYASDNTTKNIVRYPSAYKNVIGVGSVNEKEERSYFSQANSSVFVCAPGENIITINDPINDKLIGELYEDNVSGTSLSTAHVSAMAGLMASIDESINQDMFKDILMKTSKDLGTEGKDTEYGYGMIDIKAGIGYFYSELERLEKGILGRIILKFCVVIWNFIIKIFWQ